MRFFYMTSSYPYGVGEEWKYNEIEVLREYFKDISVLPERAHGTNRHDVIEGVEYLPPLFDKQNRAGLLKKIITVLFSRNVGKFFKEFSRIPKKNKTTIFAWLGSSYRICRYLNHPFVKKLEASQEPCILYFFWARGTSEMVPFLKNPNVFKVVRLHRFDLFDYEYPFNYMPYQEEQIAKSDLLLPISGAGKDYLHETFPDHKSKILVKRLGTKEKGLAVQSTDGVLRIASCSFVKPVKQLDIMAKAIAMIPENIKVEWLHVGGGEREEVDRLTAITNTFDSHIKFRLTGSVKSAEVKDYYVNKEIDLFLNTSRIEGVPVSIMEAYSCGIPCLAYDVGGVSEMVNDKNGGVIDPNSDISELTNKIVAFYKLDEVVKQKMREAAYNMYKTEYDASNNAHKLAKLIVEAAKS